MSPKDVRDVVTEIVLLDKTLEDIDDDLILFLETAWPTLTAQDN